MFNRVALGSGGGLLREGLSGYEDVGCGGDDGGAQEEEGGVEETHVVCVLCCVRAGCVTMGTMGDEMRN